MEELGDYTCTQRYRQVKAAATGDPLVLEQADLTSRINHPTALRCANLRARENGTGRRLPPHVSLLLMPGPVPQSCKKSRPQLPRAKCLALFLPEVCPWLTEQKLATSFAGQVLALLGRAGGKEWLGRWSGTQSGSTSPNQGKTYLVDLLVGSSFREHSIRCLFRKNAGQGQRWRFAHAIEQRIVNADTEAARELAVSRSIPGASPRL